MHCEIIDRYLNVFFIEIELKKKTWKVFFGRQSLGAQTGILVSRTTWIHHLAFSAFSFLTNLLDHCQTEIGRSALHLCHW